MARSQPARARTAGRRTRDADDDRPAARSEELHIRSYAHEWAYDLRVTVVTPDGEVAFESEYYLRPGHTESEIDALPPGEYEVRATLDDERRATARCRLGPDPDRTAVIEVGNGLVSLTQGLPTR